MYQIQRVTADALQSQTVMLEDGSALFFELYFRPLQKGWFFNVISRDDFTVRGIRVVNSPNILHQYRTIMPYGIACFSAGDREPGLQSDFINGDSKLYILTPQEVIEFTEYLTK